MKINDASIDINFEDDVADYLLDFSVGSEHVYSFNRDEARLIAGYILGWLDAS